MRLELALIFGVLFFCCWCAYIVAKMNASVNLAAPGQQPHEQPPPPTAPQTSNNYHRDGRLPAVSLSRSQANANANADDNNNPYLTYRQPGGGSISGQRWADGDPNLASQFIISGGQQAAAGQLPNSNAARRAAQLLALDQRPALAGADLGQPANYSAPPEAGPTWPNQDQDQDHQQQQRLFEASVPVARHLPVDYQQPQPPQQQWAQVWPLGMQPGGGQPQQPLEGHEEAGDQAGDSEPDQEQDQDDQADQAEPEPDQQQQQQPQHGGPGEENEELAERRSFDELESDSNERDQAGNLILTERRHLINGRPVRGGGGGGGGVSRRARQDKDAAEQTEDQEAEDDGEGDGDGQGESGQLLERKRRDGMPPPSTSEAFDRIVDEIDSSPRAPQMAARSGGQRRRRPGASARHTARRQLDGAQEAPLAPSSLERRLGEAAPPSAKAKRTRSTTAVRVGKSAGGRPGGGLAGRQGDPTPDETMAAAPRKEHGGPSAERDQHEHRLRETISQQQWDEDNGGDDDGGGQEAGGSGAPEAADQLEQLVDEEADEKAEDGGQAGGQGEDADTAALDQDEEARKLEELSRELLLQSMGPAENGTQRVAEDEEAAGRSGERRKQRSRRRRRDLREDDADVEPAGEQQQDPGRSSFESQRAGGEPEVGLERDKQEAEAAATPTTTTTTTAAAPEVGEKQHDSLEGQADMSIEVLAPGPALGAPATLASGASNSTLVTLVGPSQLQQPLPAGVQVWQQAYQQPAGRQHQTQPQPEPVSLHDPAGGGFPRVSSPLASGSQKRRAYKKAASGRQKSSRMSSSKQKAAKAYASKAQRSRLKKGQVAKKRRKSASELSAARKHFKGTTRGLKAARGLGASGANKGATYHKDKGYRKRGFKKQYHKLESGDHKTYFDEFRDKDHDAKWNKFHDKHKYSKRKKWAGGDSRHLKRRRLAEARARHSKEGHWRERAASKQAREHDQRNHEASRAHESSKRKKIKKKRKLSKSE